MSFQWCYYYINDENHKIYGNIYGPYISKIFTTFEDAKTDLLQNIPYNYNGFVFRNENYNDIIYKTSNFIITSEVFSYIKNSPFNYL